MRRRSWKTSTLLPESGSRAALPSLSRRRAAHRKADHRFSVRPERAASARHQLSDPHGARHPDAGPHAGDACRLLPRFRLAPRAIAPPPRPRGAVRIGLSHPVEAGPEIARRPVRRRQDFTDLHAWCEVYLPGAGWVGLDPTSGLFAGEGHIPLACAANPTHSRADQRRARRMRGPASEFEMSIRRVVEPPRVTKPYTDDQWRAIGPAGRPHRCAAERRRCAPHHGRRADLRLDRRHGRRGMDHSGGRPHQARLGRHADPPPARPFRARRLPAYGQGKWYPGESLPALGLRALLARRRRAPCGATPPASPASARTTSRPSGTRAISRPVSRGASTSIPAMRWRPMRTRGTISARSGCCRSMSIR